MDNDLPRARNIDAAPVEMYWTARTRSFLPRPVQVTRDRLFPLLVRRSQYGSLRDGSNYVVTLSIVRPSVRSVPP
eukprot:scaffold325697_cov35-Attheya_sp.AAC.1